MKYLGIVFLQVKFKTYELTQTHHRLVGFLPPPCSASTMLTSLAELSWRLSN